MGVEGDVIDHAGAEDADAEDGGGLGGLHVVTALQRFAPPSSVGCRLSWPLLLLLLLLPLSSLSSLTLLAASLASLALLAWPPNSAIDCLWRSSASRVDLDRLLAPRPFLYSAARFNGDGDLAPGATYGGLSPPPSSICASSIISSALSGDPYNSSLQ